MTRRLAFAALAAALACCLAACSSGGSAQPSASPSQNSDQKQLAVAKRFAKCARDHGHPNFSDPVIDRNGVGWPPPSGAEPAAMKNQIAAAERIPECKAIFSEFQAMRSRAEGPGGRPTGKPSAEVIQQLRRLAQCMRQHGVPAWPDPKSDGSFPISETTVGDPKASPAVRAARQACRQYDAGTENFGHFS